MDIRQNSLGRNLIEPGTAHNVKKGFTRYLTYTILVFFTVQTIYPIVWMIFGSFKSNADLATNVWGPPRSWIWKNYTDAWQIGKMGSHIGNSIIVTVASLILLLIVATLAAYAIARLEFPGRRLIFYAIIATMIVPPQVTSIPLFMVVNYLGLLSSRMGLILIYAASGIAFSIFILRGFFLSIPREIEDAALIDGANRLQIFLRIVLPLSGPGIAVVAIFEGMQFWNDFFLAFLLVRDPELHTIPLGLVNFFFRYKSEWTLYFAALTMVTLPVILLFILMQRQFIEGLSAGAVKG